VRAVGGPGIDQHRGDHRDRSVDIGIDLLSTIALVGCSIPARDAARVDPLEAVRTG